MRGEEAPPSLRGIRFLTGNLGVSVVGDKNEKYHQQFVAKYATLVVSPVELFTLRADKQHQYHLFTSLRSFSISSEDTLSWVSIKYIISPKK
jgi:hypothetical protein